MKSSLRQSPWWVWLLPTLIGADLPLLVVGFATARITDNPVFSLWAWVSAVLITTLAIWAANRNVSYVYSLGILTNSIGLSLLVFDRLLWNNRSDFFENLHRLPAILRNHVSPDITLMRTAGLFAIGVGVLFLVYDAIGQRRR
jgi:hypothetical protein